MQGISSESETEKSPRRVTLLWLTPLALLPVIAVIVLFLSLQPIWRAYQVQDFLTQLDNSGPEEWEPLMESLVSVHKEIIGPLSKWIDSPSVERRIKSVTVLARLPSNRVNGILLRALKDEDVRVWRRCESALINRWQRTDNPVTNSLFEHGLQLLRNQEWDEARKVFDFFVQREPPFPPEHVAEAYCQRAEAFYQEDAIHECLRDCQEALRLNPSHFGALLIMGMCYHREKNIHLAYDAYKRALEIHPHLDSARQMVEMIEDARKKAEEMYNSARERNATESREDLPLHLRRIPEP